MNRRCFLRSATAASAGMIFGGSVSGAPVLGRKRPNIIMILVDDMGYSDIGCYGGEVDTPNLNYLAENGIRFTQMQNTSKCFPSRACLLTGVYAQQCGMSRRHGEIKNAVTIGEVLKNAGYTVWAAGKHHGTENLYDRGFDHYYGLRDGCCNFFNPGFQRDGEPKPDQKRYGKRVWCIDEKTLTPYTPADRNFYTTDAFTEKALGWIDEHEDKVNPFFLYLSYTAPHDPLQAWPRDIEKYADTYKVGYEPIRKARYVNQKRMGLWNGKAPLSDETHRNWESLSDEDKKKESRRMAVYAAMIDRVDQNIGRVLRKLKELGKLENTLVMFASDNGSSAEVAESFVGGSGEIGSMTYWASLGKNWANVSNTPFRYWKNESYAGGICTPFIACWPGVITNGGAINHHSCHFIDLMATLVDIADAEYPDRFRGQNIYPMQGQSLYPVFRGADLPARGQPLFWQWGRGYAVRSGKWKAVGRGGKWELFDMSNDLSETIDLSSKFPEKLAELKRLHQQWYASTPAGK